MVSPASITFGQSAVLSTDLLSYYRQVSQSTLTVVDLETTGSTADKARVIEVSVLQASLDDGIHHQDTHLINPGVKVPAMITRVTGITPAMVGQGKLPEDVWPDLLPRLEQGVLTAHNIEFDYRFIQSEYRHMDFKFTRPPQMQFCTVLLSRLLLADLPSRSLPDLVKHFKFDVGPSHRAEADTTACWLLAEYLLQQIRAESDEVLLGRFAQQWVRLRDAAKLLKCSKYKAQKILDGQGAECRTSRRNTRFLYRRRDVERVYYELQGQQLSLNGMA
ncbi:3'-5' exonuclease [filamentous cyanobacterium CCP5]|nr:3'-5' exonuclease [filamentous cyanobacterium CCP5]